MNLLLINYEYPPLGGGAATATQALASALADLGSQVTVLTARAPAPAPAGEANSETSGPIAVERLWTGRKRVDRCSLPGMAMFLVMALARLPGLLLSRRFHGAILFFGFPCGFLGLALRWIFRVPYVVALRGGDVPGTEPRLDPLHRLLRPIRRAIYRHALAVTANSEGLRNRSLAADPAPVRVIPNGVAAAAVPDRDTRHGNERIVLFAGRLAPQKNVALLLQAFQALPASAARGSRLVLAGDGPLRAELQALALSLGIADRVTFPGWVDRQRMPELYRQASVFVLPSRYEGMSNVLLEAMAAALPVIATDVEGVRELLRHEDTGIVVPPGNADELTRQLERLLSEPALRRRLGQAARQTVERSFSWETAARSYLDLFPSSLRPIP